MDIGHKHDYKPPASLKNLVFAMVINGVIVVFEMIFGLFIQSMALISDAVPPGIDFTEVRNDLLAIDDVVEVNDLHIWQTGADQKLLSAHLRMTEEASDPEMIIHFAQEMLLHKYGINHTTIQILPFSAREREHCNNCN